MNHVTPALLVAAVGAGAALLLVAGRVAWRRRAAPALPPAPEDPADDVTVLLPVRDEEANLPRCLDTLLVQTARPHVLVIDDGSTDATPALAAERAAAEPRLSVIRAGPLPDGWGGKVHALHRGHEHLLEQGPTPAWLLSTDADTRHHPHLLARARAAADADGLDAVSVAGHQRVRGPAENLLTPPVFALLDAVLGDWRRVARGDGPPVANGQFILLRQTALARAGGFAAIRALAIDDVGLARRLAATGSRVGFFRAPELLRVRMYRGFRAVHRGWRRNLGGLFGPDPARSALAFLVLLLPPLLLAACLLATAWLPALLLWLAGATSSAVLRQSSGHHPAWGLLYPLDSILLAVTLVQGFVDWRRGHLLPWKGRKVEAR